MIELILITPLIFCLILLFTKSKKTNNIFVIIYAFLHLFASIKLYIGHNSTNNLNTFLDFYFKADNLNILFLLTLSTIFAGISIYNNGFIKNRELQGSDLKYYSITVLVFIFSMTGAILSTNLALSWVFIEATTLASAYLIYFNKTKHSIEAAWKYVFICSVGIALAFVGIIILSIATGKMDSLFYSDLYSNASLINPFWLKLSFVFILIGIGTKMGLAPVHFWLPDAHSEAPAPISALLSATLLNSAFLIILRVLKLMNLAHIDHYAKVLMIIMGLLSIFVAAVFIYKINNYKRMLAYSSIENMGIMAIGAAVGGLGLYASLLHMIGHSLIKSSFFLTAGNILKIFKTKKINEISGIIEVDKKTGWLWILCFAGITGLPPSPLFISEFLLLKSLIEKNHFIITGIFLILLTIILYGIGKVIINMSFDSIETEVKTNFKDKYMALNKMYKCLYIPQIIFIAVSIIIGIYIPPFLNELIKNAVAGF
ncbi:MAG: proton-conducting transporter membrane subunit [Candidatus Gastranaerophilales bacterium]|nr:proton-conducting transporter membrane subunit [Candidatus Gastranaerophilales bacterium]